MKRNFFTKYEKLDVYIQNLFLDLFTKFQNNSFSGYVCVN